MAERKQFFGMPAPDPDLSRLLRDAPDVTEAELREQRISFAFGNAPVSLSERITKESVRLASANIRLSIKDR